MRLDRKIKIGILGMGYVGLPLAIEFSKFFKVVGFDVCSARINQLIACNDLTKEISNKELKKSKNILFTSESSELKSCNVFIVTVPTPVNKNNQPDLKPLTDATKQIGKVLKKNDVVIYESTVFPGATEEECVPILEKNSRLKLNKDFFVGYSPERINPGDKKRKLTDIVKVISGSSFEAKRFINKLYKKIIPAGTIVAERIREAEAAKVIENIQRDLNIALINELAILFDKMNIDTEEVLKIASTKWNFQKFSPGLVGGHCIGVDPYYLTHKAKSIGYRPEIILSGRKINDGMSKYVIDKLLREMSTKKIKIKGSNILIMGISFKENCSDIRNSKVINIVSQLEDIGCNVVVYDPWVDSSQIKNNFNITLTNKIKDNFFDAVVVAVKHDVFKKIGIKKIRKFGRKKSVIFDLKYLLKKNEVDIRL
tara:strand:+ start:965 stop:2242 length:1278 start_codon:yes stop_codon:yes gene_type:complete